MDNHNKNPTIEQTYLTPTDISNTLHICYNKSLDFVKYSGIKYVRIGRCYRVSEKVFYDFLATHHDINIDEFKAKERN